MTVSDKKRLQILVTAQAHSISIAAEVWGVSKGSIRNWAKTRDISFPSLRSGRKRHPKLRDVKIPPHKNTTSRHRYYLLHIYNHTCYDCGHKDPSGKTLQQHADYNKYPVEVLILCTKCHGIRERHGKNSKNDTVTLG